MLNLTLFALVMINRVIDGMEGDADRLARESGREVESTIGRSNPTLFATFFRSLSASGRLPARHRRKNAH